MSRKKRTDKIAKFRRYDGTEIRRKCLRWVHDNTTALKGVGPLDVDECATDRQEDVWEPLVTISEVVGGGWETRIREAARHLSGGANAAGTEAIGHQLLSAMRDYFAANGDKASTKALIEWLNELGDFAGTNRGRGITPYFLSKHLKPYGIESRDLKISRKVLKGYDQQDCQEAFQAYLSPPDPKSDDSRRDSATEAANADQNPRFQSATALNGSVSENTVSANDHAAGRGVADSKSEDVLDAEKEAILL